MVAAVVLHFHPGWAHGRRTVIEAIAVDGRAQRRWRCLAGFRRQGALL